MFNKESALAFRCLIFYFPELKYRCNVNLFKHTNSWTNINGCKIFFMENSKMEDLSSIYIQNDY